MVSLGSTCHSLVRRVRAVSGAPDAIAAALDDRVIPGFTRVWTMFSQDRLGGPRATRLRETERRRPLAPGISLRCVLLVHTDAAELIMVADRTALPLCCLRGLAAGASHAAHLGSADHHPRPEPRDHTPLVLGVGQVCSAVLRQDEVLVALDEPGAEPIGFHVRPAESIATRVAPTDPVVGLIVTNEPRHEYLPVLGAHCPLTVVAHVSADRPPEVSTYYDRHAVSPAQGAALAAQLPRRLSGSGPGPFVLEQTEIDDIVRTGRGTEPVVRLLASVPDAFAAIVASSAERPALTGADGNLTYRELDEASRAAASALVAQGIEPGDRVGVGLPRSSRAIVTILAVLRAGACYVPLDTALPPARRTYLASDADLRLIVTEEKNELAPGIPIVSLDALLSEGSTLPLPAVGPDDAAYVIYTSGTTGDPNGVVVPHRNLLALVAATRSAMNLGPSDVWTMFHSMAFDFSVWEIFGCLLTGGRLVVVPYWTARTPHTFARLIRDEKVTVLSQTPSAFLNLIPAVLADRDPVDLRLVIFGGEALRPAALKPWVRRFPLATCRLVNMYGITETTVHVTSHVLTASDIVDGSRSVGRPLPGWSVTVRSGDGTVLPFGVAGEICVGGAGLARGYLGRAELTAARFPADLWSGEHYYRSGDLGVLNSDGTLEHLGRIDDQVKIRGYRVELGEIRTALLREGAVRDAVVTFRESDEGGAICAFVVVSADVSATTVRRHLRARLPDYMVPAVLRIVESLPLTVNGKVDLEALLARPDLAGPPPPAPPRAATTLESAVQQVWVEVFDDASPDHNFFDLGGTSLQALTVARRLSDIGPRKVDPIDVYLNPTVVDLLGFLAAVD